MERKKFPFAYGSINAWNATSASSRFIGRRMSSDPNSYGFGCPTLPRKLPMTEGSGLKTFDAPGSDGLLMVVTSPIDGAAVGAAAGAAGACATSAFVRSSASAGGAAAGGGGPDLIALSS